MVYLIVACMGYLLGCSSMALYLSRWKKVDMRDHGSGNLGASNATMLMGWGAGVAVAVHDVLKAVLAVVLARWWFPDLEYAGAVAGVCSVLGHIFPFFLKFQGGKGFASYFGMTLALNWKLALVIALAAVIITWLTDYIVLATTATVVSVPAYLGYSSRSWMLMLILCIASAVIIYKHRMNYVRIAKGTEFRLRSAVSGEHRIR